MSRIDFKESDLSFCVSHQVGGITIEIFPNGASAVDFISQTVFISLDEAFKLTTLIRDSMISSIQK